jgi:RNA-directed DNA polymerase
MTADKAEAGNTVTMPTAGATSRAEEGWHTINWPAAHRNVCRLQARIVKATQEGRWGKVKALQHLLTHSFSGKAIAVKRVTENQGKDTPGVDRVIWNTPEKKMEAVLDLGRRGYHPKPLRRVLIPKSNGKMRPLGIPTMKDRAMQALYLLALDPIAETTADPNSYGFRKERSTADAMMQCYIILARKGSAPWVLEGDIKSCFDKISHDWLLNHVPMDKVILRKWLKAGYMEKHAFHPTEEGTPQGGIISPALANLALDGLERRLKERYPKPNGGTADPRKVNMVRYADDFIITGTSKELLEDEVRPFVERFMKERGLELSREKTVVTHMEDGFDFLGHNVRKYHGKYISKPSCKNVKAFLGKVRGIVKANKQAKVENLIGLLNPVIRGWASYHRHDASKRTFESVDAAIFRLLWRWAKRRHPNKSRSWVKDQYFRTRGDRRWVFSGEDFDSAGNRRSVWIFSASKMPITRHPKIKEGANPYDPAWEIYFEERLGVKMTQHLVGKWKLLYLWKEQRGICPVCRQPITEIERWHSHHIIGRTKGGDDSVDNLVLLHPNCHRQVHHRGLTVAKPCPARGKREA